MLNKRLNFMKYLLTILFFITVTSTIAQTNSFVKYFDSTWKPCTKEKASFYTQFEKQDTAYKCTSYYLPSNKLYGKSTFYDTLFKKRIGLAILYYENGKVMDSSYEHTDSTRNYMYKYYDNGNLKDSFAFGNGIGTSSHFYENGQLCAHASFNKELNTFVSKQGYDSLGNIIPNFIFQKAAAFKGGLQGWITFLEANLKSSIPVKKGAPIGRYTVVMRFTIDAEGNTSDISAENDPGYGTKEEALRVMKKSPKWEPAILYGKNVAYRHRQSITFQVSDN